MHRLLLKTLILAFVFVHKCSISEGSATGDSSKVPLEDSLMQDVNYLLLIPRALTSGEHQQACVLLQNVPRHQHIAVEVRLHNRKDTENYDTNNASFGHGSHEHCFAVQVPEVTGKNMKIAVVDLQISRVSEDGNALLFHENKSLVIRPAAINLYINTDKPVYKPGQKVQFRILQLDYQLKPTTFQISKITISDPKDRTLLVLNDQAPSFGLVSGDFQLISEPTQGDWKITVACANKKYTTKFRVEEYVLPKFEVTIEPPAYLHVESPDFEIKICGKYTYGKPVIGMVDVVIGAEKMWVWMPERPSQRARSKTDQTGCAIVVGSPSELQFTNKDYAFSGHLKIIATITEEATGVTLSGENKECILTTKPYQIEYLNRRQPMKPGLPWKSTIIYSKLDGERLPDRLLTVEVSWRLANFSYTERKRIFNITTDSKGEFELSLEGEPDGLSYNLAIYDPSLPGYESGHWTKPHKIRRDVAYLRLEVAYSTTFSYLTIPEDPPLPIKCPQKRFRLHGKITLGSDNPEVLDNEVKVYYKVMSKFNLVSVGSITAKVSSDRPCQTNEERKRKGLTEATTWCFYTYEIFLDVDESWMPTAKVIVYTIKEDDGEVVPADIQINVESCFKNQASVKFSSDSVRPGGDVAVKLSADPGSLCALSIVDKSVHLLGGDNTIKSSKIRTDLEQFNNVEIHNIEPAGCGWYNPFSYQYSINEEDEIIDRYNWRTRRSTDSLKRKSKRSVYPHYGEYHDAFSSFDRLDLMFLSNLRIHLMNCTKIWGPPIAVSFMDMAESETSDVAVPRRGLKKKSTDVIEVRNYFPETWKWDLVQILENGEATLANQKMPDTITEWIASSYCISETSGIGITEQAMVKGFKPVFLSMTLPYSIIRGEQITIKSTLFSYLSKGTCLEMKIAIEKTEHYDLVGEENGNGQFTECICGGEARTLDLEVIPKSLGKILFTMRTWSSDGDKCGEDIKAHPTATDGVERSVLVEAEGEEIEFTSNNFMCIEEGDGMVKQTQDVALPDDVIDGSARLLVNVIGSIMGPVMNNLDHLIRVPYGCGEQNMVTMVPNIVVLDYLKATNRLKPSLEKQIVGNIRTGYQRQLNYQRKDGSFSAFGDRDTDGSTWLTAFVISTFAIARAREYIFVDNEIMQKAQDFLMENAHDNGCFMKKGMVHNKRMMGGADGKNSLHSYVILSLVTAGLLEEENQANEGEIRGCDGEMNLKIYTKALLFYVSTLGGDYSKARVLWNNLKPLARFSNGQSVENADKAYWSDEEVTEDDSSVNKNYWWAWYREPSDAVEVTGYVLLGYLRLADKYPEEFSLSSAFSVVQWLTAQRNAYGGWSSTQNTIIGLTALAAYATQTHVEDTQMTVTTEAEQGFSESFQINNQNGLTVQQTLISPVPTSISYSASGKGCVLVQTTSRYNVPKKVTEPSFTISTQIKSSEMGCEGPGLRFLVVCATYKSSDEEAASNMAVMEVKLVSGYYAVEKSLKEMVKANKHNGIKRYEIDGKKVTVYFRAIGAQLKCAAFEVDHNEDVKNVQPGTARVYDYYDPTKEASMFFTMNCRDETYKPSTHSYDCMEWRENGICKQACLTPRVETENFCLLFNTMTLSFDYCKVYGDNSCGDNGRCIRTETYYRCSCNSGYKNNRWSRGCIPIDEEEPDIGIIEVVEVPTILPDISLFCDNNICLPTPALRLQEGNETIYFCFDGHTLTGSGNESQCEDINECEDDPCDGDNVECLNNHGSYDCKCAEGYQEFVDADEGIVDSTHCMETEDEDVEPGTTVERNQELPELPEPPKVEIEREEEDFEPGRLQEEDEGPEPDKVTEESEYTPSLLTRSCPTCLTSFPEKSEYDAIFCPKMNGYIITNSLPGKVSVRSFLIDGKKYTSRRLKQVKIDINPMCDCETLLKPKSILLTPSTLSETEDQKSIYIDGESKFLVKKSWKRILAHTCPHPEIPIPPQEPLLIMPDLISLNEPEEGPK